MSAPDLSAVDLREGTVWGDLFWALYDFAEAHHVFRVGRSKTPPDKLLPLFEDYNKARVRWPGKRLMPLCRLMRENSRKLFGGRYNNITADTLRKRIVAVLNNYSVVVTETGGGLKCHMELNPPRNNNLEQAAIVATRAIKKRLAGMRRRA